MAKLAIALLAAPAAAFAPTASRPGLAPLRNAFGVDATYPAFLPQGGVGGTGPMPGDDPMGVMPWEREAPRRSRPTRRSSTARHGRPAARPSTRSRRYPRPSGRSGREWDLGVSA